MACQTSDALQPTAAADLAAEAVRRGLFYQADVRPREWADLRRLLVRGRIRYVAVHVRDRLGDVEVVRLFASARLADVPCRRLSESELSERVATWARLRFDGEIEQSL